MTEVFIVSALFFIGFAIFCVGAWITTELSGIKEELRRKKDFH